MDVYTAAISLVKTVGLGAGCAETDILNVPVGTEVTYCYTVENTGDIALTVHDLVDSALGDLLSGFAYDLAPGATYVFTETAVVTADVTNSATWTAWVEAEGAYAEATDTATVTVYEPYTYIYLPIMLKDWSTDR